MRKKLLSSVCASVLVVSMWGACATVLAEGATYTIDFVPNGGTGTMAPQDMPVGAKETLNPNEFEYKVNVSYDTSGGKSIATDVLDYPFMGWTSMTQVTEEATNMACWSVPQVILDAQCVTVSHDDETGIDTIGLDTKPNKWEKVYSSTIYLEPATEYSLTVNYKIENVGKPGNDIVFLGGHNMKLSVMPASKAWDRYDDEEGAGKLGSFVYEKAVGEWHKSKLTFTTPDSSDTNPGQVYLLTNYGNLADAQTIKIQYKDMVISKLDSAGSSDPEALFYADEAEVGNIGETAYGRFVFEATWDTTKSITLPKPEKDCSVFEKWTDGTNDYAAGDKISPAADLKLTAVWEDELVHDWGAITYEWSDDYSSCKATKPCLNDDTHSITETVDTTSQVTKNATCTDKGETTYTADFTKDVFEDQTKTVADIPATGHKEVTDAAVPATCTKDGLTEGSHCSVCKAVIKAQAKDPATGHKWGDWKETKPATVKEQGEKQHTCSVCGAVEKKAVPKLTPVPTKKADPTKKPAKATATPTAKPEPTKKADPTKKPAKPTATPTAKPKPTKKAEPTKSADVSLMLNKTKVNIVCGKTDTLKATLKGASGKISWKTSDKKIAAVDANGKITAKMAGTVTITASAAGKTATCEVTVLYKDVTNTKDFWYAPTNYLTAKGVVKGYDNQTNFKPANECTRAQMVTFIWRLMGEPSPKIKTCKFKDVREKDYFYKACLWGNEKHIVEGYKDGTFGPQIVCARKHAVTFLWRLAGCPDPKSSKNKFSDVKKSDYYYKATIWASEKNILAGYSDGTFRPNGDCLRRQMVTFLYKYDKCVNNKG